MKYLKIFEDFKDKSKIKEKLDYYGIENYTINDDGTIDVDGNVNLSYSYLRHDSKLKKIPFNFGEVTGYFNCSGHNITSLEGSPYYVGKNFNCSSNKLINLVGSPEEIGGDFDCYSNHKLNSVLGMSIEIGKGFFTYDCPKLKELESMSNIEGIVVVDPHCKWFGERYGVNVEKFKGYCKEIEIR
jgi:hypothetical protein